MQFFDFITQDELDELAEDPEAAFTQFVRIAQRRLGEFTRDNPPRTDSEWQALNEARHSFVNIIVAVAKRYDIEPFSTMPVPLIEEFDDNRHKQFRADLDHYIAQLVVGNSIRGRRDSVQLPAVTRDKLRTYLRALREAVEKADLGDARRSALLDKLDAFERELEKRRLSLLELTRVVLAIAAIPGGLWASADVTMKLVSNVIQAVGEAKAAEDETRQLAAPTEFVAISGPRRSRSASDSSLEQRGFEADLDDEIPF